MRYYTLALTPPGSTKPTRVWTSYPNGQPDPNALNIIFDVIVTSFGVPSGNQYVYIEGVSLEDLLQSQQFVGQNLSLTVGMGGGLPLENPQQIGTIMLGTVLQSYGNWVGNDMTLNFIVTPGFYTTQTPGAFVLEWRKGVQLGPSMTTMLTNAYQNTPLGPPIVKISPNWVNNYDVLTYHTTPVSFSTWLRQFTDTSPGPVQVVGQGGGILVYDNTWNPEPIQLQFTDLIGQPTWYDVKTVQIKTVIRADIQLGSNVKLPVGYINAPGAITTTAASQPSFLRYKTTFTGLYNVTKIRHIGNFRSSDGGEWATILNCVLPK